MTENLRGKFLNHKNARTEEQKRVMAQIEADGVCPFCAEHFTTYHPKPILKETDFWFVTENMSPYDGTRLHFIFVYKPSHIISPKEMVPGALDDLLNCINWIVDENSVPGGSFFMRFGDPTYTGGSVDHLHAQFIVGEQESGQTEPIRVKLGHKKK